MAILWLILISITACAPVGQCKEKGSPMSVQMKEIITSLKIDDYTLDVSKLPKNTERSWESLAKDGDLESYKLPRRRGMEDTFLFEVYYDKKNTQYWVICSGGFAGVLEVYGPVKFTQTSNERR